MLIRSLSPVLCAIALPLAACALDEDREPTREVTVELDGAGAPRVLTPASLRGGGEPAAAARAFVVAHGDALGLAASQAASFAVRGVDRDAAASLVRLQRTIDGVPIFHGGVQVALDAQGHVVRATVDEAVGAGVPRNHGVLAAAEAVTAARRAARAGDAELVAPAELRALHVGDGDDRWAYEVVLAWPDGEGEQQMTASLIDAETGERLAEHSLVDHLFTGKVFAPGAQPLPSDTTDRRVTVSFDGDPVASPTGWLAPLLPPNNEGQTKGRNATACGDVGGNSCTSGAVVPTSMAHAFVFPFSPTSPGSVSDPAAISNAFFYVNDLHDRMFALGFTPAAGNFQDSDPVKIVLSPNGTNNVNFATPPDGSIPRLQIFSFHLVGGHNDDAAFDGSAIYHEVTHGLSNRLVGGGATTCLNGRQSGGLGEGWSDFIAASILNNPVIGGYISGNTTTGIRRQSMASSTWSYNDVRTGVLMTVQDIGELWAATLWDIRKLLGAHAVEQLVVLGMKTTPCNPTLLNARDGLLSADQIINGAANKCTIWRAFAARLMGTGASSPNHNSTTQIVTSIAVPAGC